MNFFYGLPSNPWAWLLVFILSVVSVLLGCISLSKKKIMFSLSHNKIITDEQTQLPYLNIQYNGIEVVNLTVTKLVFWNDSFATINHADIIDKDPLLIRVDNGQILDAYVLAGDDSSNNIAVSFINDNTICIEFDYLDRKEGGIIQIVHSGKKSRIKVSKKLKGGKIAVEKFTFINNIVPIKALLCTIIFFAVFPSDYLEEKVPVSMVLEKYFSNNLVAFYIIFVLLGVLLGMLIGLITYWRYTPKNCR